MLVSLQVGGLAFRQSDVLYRKRCVSKQSRQLCKGLCGEQRIPTRKVHGFKRYDKVRYLGKVCFVKARRTDGHFVLMDIANNSLDFRDMGGKQNPSYKSIERISARRSILCISERIERKEWYKNVVRMMTV